jgi:hypothetical protein
MDWYTLGFTYDDIVGAWQDWRLAQQCAHAFAGQERLAGEVREEPGEGKFLVRWYVSRTAAEILDEHHVPWRQFLVGTGTPPASARQPLKV